MIKSIQHMIMRLFSVPTDNPQLVKAQFAVFSRQIPLMYSIVLVNAWAISLLFMDVAPIWLTVVVPAVFSAACCVRLLVWWRSRSVSPSAEFARHALVRTNQVAAILAGTITAWVLLLSRYGDSLLNVNVAFFMAVTGVSVVVCLLHLRSAAFIVAAIISVPFVVRFSLHADPSFVAMAINILFVMAALLVVVVVQSAHFANAIDARTKLEAANEENLRLANLDSLTGLNNRRQFFAKLEAGVRAADSDGKSLAVGIVDLDGFKPINDLYGHAVGDAVLVEVGRRLTEFVGTDVHLSRLGGDEFALIFRDYAGNDELLERGEQICACLRQPLILPDAVIRVTASMGLAIYPAMAGDALGLYERADYALYNGKRANCGHAMLFSERDIEEIARTSRIEQVLRGADLNEEISVFFQPIVDTRSGRPVAVEALARWTSPELGEVAPALFIPVAERAGVVSMLTRVVLTKSLAAAAKWPDNIRLSVNLSTHDLSSSEGIARIVAILHASEIAPERVDFEITETAMMFDFAQSKASIELLRRLGCGIALDDVGTGYSSLSQIHALPLTKIKIDRSFVSGIDGIPTSYKIVKSLLALSRDMGLDCVVEGVENDNEMATVAKLGGRLIQGYYFSRPVAEEDLAALLAGSAPARAKA